jgi:hypothetical protein
VFGLLDFESPDCFYDVLGSDEGQRKEIFLCSSFLVLVRSQDVAAKYIFVLHFYDLLLESLIGVDLGRIPGLQIGGFLKGDSN